MSQKMTREFTQDISGSSGKSAAQPTQFHTPNTIRSRARLKLLYAISAGPVEGMAAGAASLKLDGVPVGDATSNALNIGGVNWRFSHGDSDEDDAVGGDVGVMNDGFNAVEVSEPVGHRLLKDLPHSRVSPHQHTQAGDMAKLTLQFPLGLARSSDIGVVGAQVRLKFETRNPDGTWSFRAERVISEKQTSAFEIQISISFNQQYTQQRPAVRITRLNSTSTTSEVADRVVWKAISWMKADRLSYQGVSTLAVTYDAEAFGQRLPQLELSIKGRLVRVPVNYDPKVRHYDGIWNGKFKLAFSNNPAWVVFDLLTDKTWGLGLDPGLIEAFDLYELAKYNDEDVDDGQGGVEPRFLFDAVLARRVSAPELIKQICSAMHVIMFWSAGRLRFVQDRPQMPVMWITNDHVIDGKFVYAGTGQREQYSHALVSFTDPDRGGAIAVEAEMRRDVLARQGYSAKEVALLGCCRRSQARRHARWLLEKSDDRLFAVTWRAGLDYFAENPIRPGDVIRITDRMQGSFGAVGRMKLSTDSNGKVLVQISQFHKEGQALATYEAEDGSTQHDIQVTISHDQWAEDHLIAITPVGDWPKSPAVDKSIMLRSVRRGTTGFDFRITSVREVNDFQVEIQAIRHDNAAFHRIDTNLDIPARASEGLPDFTQPLPTATDVRVTQPQHVDGQDRLRDVVISWTAPLDNRVARWMISAAGPSGEEVTISAATPPQALRDLALGEWQIKIEAMDWLGRRGEGVDTRYVVQADPAQAIAPSGPMMVAGYGQLIISWDMAGQPHDAMVEVLELRSPHDITPRLIHVAAGTTVSLASSAGVMRYFKLRTRLRGGSLSALTIALEGAALAEPVGQDGQDGQDGVNGVDGQDGLDGVNGQDGVDGQRGTILGEGAVQTARWSTPAARDAVFRLTQDTPMVGDVVTLRKETKPHWAETRRFDGAAWIATTAMLSGEAIAKDTVPASRIKFDETVLASSDDGQKLTLGAVPADLITTGVLRSSNYQKNERGFHIDTAGTAELNNAIVRGVLDSAQIKSSVMVASARVIPTEDQDAFFTLENERPITYLRRTINGQDLELGPMMISSNIGQRRFQDSRKIVVACNNPTGNMAAGINNEFTRFWAKTPLITGYFNYEASGTPWGEDITHGRIKVTLKTTAGKTTAGRVLATSPIFRLDQRRGFQNRYYPDRGWLNPSLDRNKIILLPYTAGFHLSSSIRVERHVTRHASDGRSFTNRLNIRVIAGAEFLHDPAHDDDDTGLIMTCRFDFGEDFPSANNTPTKVLNGFYFTTDIDATTHA